MSFVHLILHNLWSRKARSAFTTVAVALAVSSVVTLGILTDSLKGSALAVLTTGEADFTVAQKGVSDVLSSTLSPRDLEQLRAYPGVETAVGVFIQLEKLDEEHPLFVLIGIPPDELESFGVKVVKGRPDAPNSPDGIMLGFRTAENFDKHVGDTFDIPDLPTKVVGIYSVGNVFGDQAAMLPLPTLQGFERQPDAITMVFVRVKPGTDIPALRKRIEHDHPQLATVRTKSEFGRVDRNLELISAADRGASLLALAVGAVIVMNTALLSFFERTREFGVLRAIGWSRLRLIGIVVGEVSMLGLIGAALGAGLGAMLQHSQELLGVFEPSFTAGVFWRALYVAAGMALLGALYPALRAARLLPLEAMRHE